MSAQSGPLPLTTFGRMGHSTGIVAPSPQPRPTVKRVTDGKGRVSNCQFYNMVG